MPSPSVVSDKWGFFYVCDHLSNPSKVHIQNFRKKLVILMKWWNKWRNRQTNKLIWSTSSAGFRILKYDWLIAFWVIIWEPEFSKTYHFHRMLKGYKYFHFRPFSDKTNDMIFWKSSKPCFWDIFNLFWEIFSMWKVFPKIWVLSLLNHYGSLTLLADSVI